MTDEQRVVLLVEDNPHDVELTLRALEKNKLANPVVVAEDGQDALDYLLHRGRWVSERPALPQLVLLDLKLPRVDGLEVLRALREDERTRTLPVVVLTTSLEESDLVASYRNGANGFVRKPVDFARFVEAVGQLGVFWLVLNELPPRR
jgi:two-component system response regulator